MIEPVSFSYNKETAVNNHFQINDDTPSSYIQEEALLEFNNLVSLLRDNYIEVITFKDSFVPHTPDSLFPNNWISFHENNIVVIYPMYAPNRRMERRLDIPEAIFNNSSFTMINMSKFEDENLYLEGTGSMVLDRQNKIAYAALSERTNSKLLNIFCKQLGYIPVLFKAYQDCHNLLPIYHTNVMMSVCDKYAIVCKESIPNSDEINNVYKHLAPKEVIEISTTQMISFAGNVLQVRNKNGKLYSIMSNSAYKSLSDYQIRNIQKYNEILVADVPTIEKYGGGSVRCMLAEIF